MSANEIKVYFADETEFTMVPWNIVHDYMAPLSMAIGDDDHSVVEPIHMIAMSKRVFDFILEIIKRDVVSADKDKLVMPNRDTSYVKDFLRGPLLSDNGYPAWTDELLEPIRFNWDMIVDCMIAVDWFMDDRLGDLFEEFIAVHMYDLTDKQICELVLPFEDDGSSSSSSSSSGRPRAAMPPVDSPYYGLCRRMREIPRRAERIFMLI